MYPHIDRNKKIGVIGMHFAWNTAYAWFAFCMMFDKSREIQFDELILLEHTKVENSISVY